jgi:hypothetical protein
MTRMPDVFSERSIVIGLRALVFSDPDTRLDRVTFFDFLRIREDIH